MSTTTRRPTRTVTLPLRSSIPRDPYKHVFITVGIRKLIKKEPSGIRIVKHLLCFVFLTGERRLRSKHTFRGRHFIRQFSLVSIPPPRARETRCLPTTNGTHRPLSPGLPAGRAAWVTESWPPWTLHDASVGPSRRRLVHHTLSARNKRRDDGHARSRPRLGPHAKVYARAFGGRMTTTRPGTSDVSTCVLLRKRVLFCDGRAPVSSSHAHCRES